MALGTFEDTWHRRLPDRRLCVNNPRLSVWELARSGGLVDGASTRLEWGGKSWVCLARPLKIQIGAVEVELTWTEPAPGISKVWWRCPICRGRCGYLYLIDPLACRACCRLDWSSRHKSRGLGRKKLGNCALAPFAPLPARRRYQRIAEYERLVAMIRAEEAALVGHLADIVTDLTLRQR